MIVGNTEVLILNQFGNYVVIIYNFRGVSQWVGQITRILDLNDMDPFKRDIVAIVTDCKDFAALIRHKFASKVIEKVADLFGVLFQIQASVLKSGIRRLRRN